MVASPNPRIPSSGGSVSAMEKHLRGVSSTTIEVGGSAPFAILSAFAAAKEENNVC